MSGKTLIEQVIRQLRPQVDALMVIGRCDQVARLRGLPVDGCLTDLTPTRGPLMAIYTGLLQTNTPLNLFVPCDMPFVDGQLTHQLMEACDDATLIVGSRHPIEGIQPFPLICHASACHVIAGLLDRGERSLHSVLRHPNAQVMTIEDPALWRAFTNVNTPKDYAQLTDEITVPS